MQSVSNAWKTAQQLNVVPLSQVEVSYKIVDRNMQTATATDNGHWTYSDVSQILTTQYGYANYTTMEHTSWLLNGSRQVLADTPSQPFGYVSSAMSQTDGTFSTNPIVTITFAGVNTTVLPGMTITWSTAFDEFATGFIVRSYNGATLLNTTTVTDNTDIMPFVSITLANYDKIEIEITDWCLPTHRARMEQIVFGQVEVFTNIGLISYKHSSSADLLSFNLPKNAITFELSNVNGEWNPFNPTGMYQYLAERQEISVRYGYDINGSTEWIKGGTFWLSGWNTPQNGITASFEARDLIVFMENPYVPTAGTYTLKQLAESAFTQSNIPTDENGNNRWNIDSSLSNISKSITASFNHTCAEVIQLCADAAQCVMYQDRDGVMNIVPLDTTLTDYEITRFNSYSNAEYELSKELKSVNVNDGQGTATNSTTGEIQLVKNELIPNATVAGNVATWVKDCLKNRRTVSGEYRADPRLDVLDYITLENKYATNTVYITTIDYTYNGAFKGNYEGRVYS